MRGSFTIEMSIVLSVVILSLVTLIYFAMFLHDKTVIQGTLNEACYIGIMNLNEALNRVDSGLYIKDLDYYVYEMSINDYIYQSLKNKLILFSQENIEIESTMVSHLLYKEISIHLEYKGGDLVIPILINTNNLSSHRKEYNYEEIVRLTDFADEISENTVYIKNLKDEYSKIIDAIREIMNRWI